MGITDYVQESRFSCTSNFGAMCDQRSGNPATAHVWLNKQRIEFAISICSRFHGGESDNRPFAFGHKYAAGGDLRDRQLDSVRVGEQGVTITGIGKGGPQLQILKLLLLRDSRAANQEVFQVRVHIRHRGKA